MVKAKLRAGKGMKASIYTRFLQPKLPQFADDKDHRSNVVLVSCETLKRNRKMTEVYTCTIDGLEGIFNAAKGSFKLGENGPEELFFVPLTAAEKAEEIDRKASTQFVEPKIKWEKSKAKKILYNLIMEGDVPQIGAWQSEARRQNQNPAERRYQTLKRMTNRILD